MQGQSPFIINTGISFTNYDKNFEIGTYFNVQGETLEIVGAGNIPDVYTQPFHNLKLNASKTFGQNKSNYINSIVINFIFAILVLPSVYFADNSLICKYWFFSLILIYTLIYSRLYRLTKN